MARFGAVLLMSIAATATVAASEVCDDTDCMRASSLLASKTTVNQRTPPAAAAYDVAGLVVSQGAAKAEQRTKADEMDTARKAADQAYAAASQKSATATKAFIAHDLASAHHRESAALTADASEARAKALAATEAATAAKTGLDTAAVTETGCQAASTAAENVKIKASVGSQMKNAQVIAAKAALAASTSALTEATNNKKTAEAALLLAQREKAASEEENTQAVAIEGTSKTAMDKSIERVNQAEANFQKLTEEETAEATKFGAEQAAAVQDRVKSSVAENNQVIAKSVYESKNDVARELDAKAMEDEEAAGVAVLAANELAKKAQTLSDSIPAVAGL